MDKTAYSGNLKEQQQFGKRLLPTKPKITITDDADLRFELELELEKLPQKLLAQWALANALPFLSYLDEALKNDSRIIIAQIALENWSQNLLSVSELRQAGFLANQLAQVSTTELSRFAARSFAQAIATGHMRGHAIVSSDYAVKVINLAKGTVPAVQELRKKQFSTAKECGQRLN